MSTKGASQCQAVTVEQSGAGASAWRQSRPDTSIHTSLRSAFLKFLFLSSKKLFLAVVIFLHLGDSLIMSAEFETSIASKLVSFFLSKSHILWSSARILFSTPFFDQVIGALIARSCNFQEQNIFMENAKKPGEVKYLQLFDGGAKYLQNSGQVACSSRRLSTPIIAPPKNFLSHFHCASMSPVWGPGFFGVEFSLDRCWVLDHALTPASLPAPADRCPAPSRSARVAPSFTFASLSFE